MCENHHIYQLIKDPTRITETSFTLIDHFYTSNVDEIVSSGVLHTGLSDHSMIYAIWGRAIKQKTFVHKYKVNRKNNRFDDKELVKHLNRVQWCQVTDINEVKGCGMGPWLVLVFPCFRENAVATCKIGSFLCSLDNLLQKNIIVLFFGNKISKWRSFEKRAIFDLLFTFLVTRESYKKSFSTYLTHIHTRILLTLFFLPYQF